MLGKLCAQWEAAAQEVNPSTRLVITRIGIVLAADGGALGKMLPIFRAGFGGPIGSGQQWMSWIARADLCQLDRCGVDRLLVAGHLQRHSAQSGLDARVLLRAGPGFAAPQLAASAWRRFEIAAWVMALKWCCKVSRCCPKNCRLSSLLFRRRSWIRPLALSLKG